VALVTGASRGIGRAIVEVLHRAGAKVVGTSTTAEGAALLERELPGSIGLVCDAGDATDVERAVAETLRRAGPIDVLVNNAGVVQRAPLSEVSDADFDRVLAVNLSGPYYFARRVIPSMVARGWGRIVNVSSISSRLGSPRMASYCASKWGLNGLTQSLAEELKGTGVTVTAILPGSVDTDMLKGSGFEPKMTAEQVAEVVRYLCAEAPEAMTGSLVEMFG
jgi:3-oxoacyl-[acyl-carrier protein] reductase